MLKKILISTALLTLWLFSANAQEVTFTNQIIDLLGDDDFYSGVSMAVTDLNGDGLDDIVRLDQGIFMQIEYQTLNGDFESVYIGEVSPDEKQWSLVVADADNNGYCDLLMGGRYDGIHYYRANDAGTSFDVETLDDELIFIQGSNLADINNDGHLDIFACHDDGESQIWANNGDGTFDLANDWIDMVNNGDPGEESSGNYGSVWTDIDNDGDQDLYIAKCRQGVNDPTDLRRINTLWINDGDNNYSNEAEDRNLAIGLQSWTADFADVDNDGDMDCFITNHDGPSQLLENDGDGYFTDISADDGIAIAGFPIQGVFKDFNNDGWVDLIISGSEYNFFLNNGDKTFTKIQDIFGDLPLESYAIGDLNNDGFLDFYGGYAEVYNNPSNTPDAIWINNGNDNNYFKVSLIGMESNKSGVGARVEIYGEWGMQIREVRAGESYGIVNSLTKHFGLGEATTIDSLVINWPSGIVDTYEDLEANQSISVIEGVCIALDAQLDVDGETVFCDGESVTLSAPDGYEYLWSTGDDTQSIVVDSEGFYDVTITDDTGCFGISGTIETIINPVTIPSLMVEGETIVCNGSSVMLSSDGFDSYDWSNGESGQSIEVTESGEYFVTIQGACEEYSSETVMVEVLEEIASPTVTGAIVNPGETATLTAIGDEILWYDEAGDLVGTGETFTTSELDETSTYYAQNINSFGGEEATGGESINLNDGSQANPQFNGELLFEVFEESKIISVEVQSYSEEERTIVVRQNGQTVESVDVMIPEGQSRIELNFELEPGEYTIGCSNFNPKLFRTDTDDLNYPYEIGDLMRIDDSTYGDGFYYYFYDWEVEKTPIVCSSETVAVEATVEPWGVNIEDKDQLDIQLYPNPSNGQISLILAENVENKLNITIFDVLGQTVYQNQIKTQLTNILNLSHLAKGSYLIQVNNEKYIYSDKLIIK